MSRMYMYVLTHSQQCDNNNNKNNSSSRRKQYVFAIFRALISSRARSLCCRRKRRHRPSPVSFNHGPATCFWPPPAPRLAASLCANCANSAAYSSVQSAIAGLGEYSAQLHLECAHTDAWVMWVSYPRPPIISHRSRSLDTRQIRRRKQHQPGDYT